MLSSQARSPWPHAAPGAVAARQRVISSCFGNGVARSATMVWSFQQCAGALLYGALFFRGFCTLSSVRRQAPGYLISSAGFSASPLTGRAFSNPNLVSIEPAPQNLQAMFGKDGSRNAAETGKSIRGT